MQKQKSTKELLNILHAAKSPSDLAKYSQNLSIVSEDLSFSEYITRSIAAKQLTISAVIQESRIQRNYGYQILNGTKLPGRDKVIALCLALKFDLEDTQRALKLANVGALYPRKKRDSILIYAIDQHLDVLETNLLLFESSESILV